MTGAARPVKAFGKAVLYGALAVGVPLALFTLPLGVDATEAGQLLNAVFWLVMPTVVALPIVLAACLLIGLPLTLILSRMGNESRNAYRLSGAAFGFSMPLALSIIADDPSGFLFALPGGFSGFVSASVWWTEARKPSDWTTDHRPWAQNYWD